MPLCRYGNAADQLSQNGFQTSIRARLRKSALNAESLNDLRDSIAHTEQQLGVCVSPEETQRLTNLAEDLRNQLVALTAEWEHLIMQLEEQASLS